ncbi:hypothetical protein GGR51DRAFT_61916 [Nemania sp. FL0031]|nr:hypothetical protein GGR51DRAFT_61916 [Nemania sp. FL0031]
MDSAQALTSTAGLPSDIEEILSKGRPNHLESGSAISFINAVGVRNNVTSMHGDCVLSLGATKTLGFTQDFKYSSNLLWSPPGSPLGDHLFMQRDGNLCLTSDGKTTWESDTKGHEGAYLVVEDDGNARVLSKDGQQLWSSKSSGNLNPNVVVPTRSGFPAHQLTPAEWLDTLDYNGIFKALVSKGLGLVPEVGGILSGLVGFLWPDKDKPQLRWDQISKGVEKIVLGLIAQDKVKELARKTESLYELIRKYDEVPYGIDQKGQKFNFILDWFTLTKRDYLDNETPWETLQYFVPMATLHLTFVRQQYFLWDKIYPNNPGAEKEAHRKELEQTIQQYTAAAKKIKDKCLEWRLDDRIYMTPWHDDGRSPAGHAKSRSVGDKERKYKWDIKLNWDNGYGGDLRYDPDLMSKRIYTDLRDYADAVYRQQIDDLLAPSLLWDQFGVDNAGKYKPVSRDVMTVTTDTMGRGYAGNMVHFNDREFAEKNGPITKIVINAWDTVDGFEIWYGGKSSGHRGGYGGSKRVLEVGEGESVVYVSGHMGDYMDSLRFWVSSDKKIAGGAMGGPGDPRTGDNFHIGHVENGPSNDPDTFRLKYVYGWYGSDHIQEFGATFFKTGTT